MSVLINVQPLPEAKLPKPDIRKLGVPQLAEWLLSHGFKAFHAKQIYKWLWQRSLKDFSEMTDLSLALRNALEAHFGFYPLSVQEVQKSQDGTLKVGFSLYDRNLVEGVLIPTEDRMTACISSQVGCSLSCKFCATGFMDKKRNLTAPEIYDQVFEINQQALKNYQARLTNIVYMGMGEPLLNYQNVLSSIEKITSPDGLGMSPKRITVSTAGIAKMIYKLADDQVKFNLALSLHAADDEKRNKIMPINDSNSLEALKEALRYFYRQTQNRITLEYILFGNFNDSPQDADNLFRFSQSLATRINIIEYNPVELAPQFQRASGRVLNQFAAYLADRGAIVTVRKSRGMDIDAACGQLANKNKV
ncbi:MAG: 23S rRNA (adenine(2503)-C(2))-methyltransferase RlmN [Cytophagales bacterium]|nr:MAG: 23S rRNA (adenine(2503)-C(2))-methyltransferase RlmN [Cytophagales bacterium]TAF60685.1 MAG: 23S rRNA (adenine(2503)-C(2))-methyltransferase RlmN [Cytophagales bacterium]